MPFTIIRNDITKVAADAIVNTANPEPTVGRGTDSAVYEAAGREKLLAARRKIGAIEPGGAAHTKAYALPARYIIHTVGPVWIDGASGERETLRRCYENSLALAQKLGCRSVAFPLISTGTYGFPKDEALEIALSAIQRFLLQSEMLVTLVVFGREAFRLSERLFGGVREFIDEKTAAQQYAREYSGDDARRYEAIRRRAEMAKMKAAAPRAEQDAEETEYAPAPSSPAPAAKRPAAPRPVSGDMVGQATLEDFLKCEEDTFQQRLFRLIDASGMDDVTVYKRANLDRKLFSAIRKKKDYRPKKQTAVALAIALRLDLKTTRDLLARAELAFSPSNKFDLIVSYFITNRNYDIFELNAVLFDYGQPLLGV